MTRRRFILNAAGVLVPLIPAVRPLAASIIVPAPRVSNVISSGISAPTDISGCVFWGDANDTSKVWQDTGASISANSDTNPVRLWQDKSGTSNHGTAPADADRPLYRTNIQNGRNILRFDGVSDCFDLANSLAALTAGEIFVVIKKAEDPASASSKGGLFRMGSHSGASSSDFLPFTDGTVYGAFGTTARKTANNPATTLAQWNLVNFSSAAGDWKFRLNTSVENSTGTNTVGFTSTPNFGRSAEGSQFLYGDVGEVILYNSVLSAGNRAAVETWLDGRWALPY